MSDKLGPQQLGKVKGEVFLGYDKGHEADYSPEVAGVVDSEVRGLIDTAHDRARAILVHPPRHPRRARQGPRREGDPRGLRPGRDLRAARQGHRHRGARAGAHRRARSRSSPSWSAPPVAEAQPVAEPGGRPVARAGPGQATLVEAGRRPSPEAQRHLTPWPRERPAIDTPMDLRAHREGGARDPRGDRRGPRPRRPRAHPRAGRPAVRRDLRRASTRTRPSTSPSPSSRATTRWSWSATSRSTACASTTSSRSAGRRTSRTSRARTAASPACRRSPGWWRATAGGPQVQEQLTVQIADAMERTLEPRGVMVIIEAEHLCMSMRGVAEGRLDHGHLGGAGAVPRERRHPPGGDAVRHRARLTPAEATETHREAPTAPNGSGIGVLGLPGVPDRPLVMGVINVTPDSFSDGGQLRRRRRGGRPRPGAARRGGRLARRGR